MSLVRFLFLVILVCFFFQCGMEEQVPLTPAKMQLSGKRLHILLFKKESSLELWMGDQMGKQLLSSVSLQKEIHYPLGVYDLQWTDSIWLPKLERNLALRKQRQLNNRPFPKIQVDLLSLLDAKERDLLGQRLKLAQQIQLLVFPSDNRPGKAFEGSMNGEPWLPELYSSLGLWLGEYEEG